MIHFLFEAILIYWLYKANKKKALYYNNYQQCLRALSESDPKLKAYLERNK